MPCLIRERKSGIYFLVLTVDGKRKWISTKTRDRKRAYQFYTAHSSVSPQTDETPKLLSPCVDEYLQYVQTTFARKTYELYKINLNHFLFAIGDVPIDTISGRLIDLFKVNRAKVVTSISINTELRTLRAFFNTLKRWELIERNPCDGISSIRIPERTPVYFDAPQLERLVKSIEEGWLREIVTFASMTGARLGEILNLQWNDVSFDNRTIIIRSTDNYQVKAGRIRTVPMNRTVYELLQNRPTREGFIFVGKRGRRANANFVSEKFREVVRRGSFDRRLHFHSLRHTFASLLVKNGVSLYQVQKLLGHSSSKVTEIYAHLQSAELHGVVDTISLTIDETMGCSRSSK